MIESRNQKVTDNIIDKGNIFPLVDFWIIVNDFGNSFEKFLRNFIFSIFLRNFKNSFSEDVIIKKILIPTDKIANMYMLYSKTKIPNNDIIAIAKKS